MMHNISSSHIFFKKFQCSLAGLSPQESDKMRT